MIKPNPFTPQSGWEPRIFGGRDEELNYFGGILEQSAANRPSHVIILGEWGTGKTSLMKQFKKLSQTKGYLASFSPISKIGSKSALQTAVKLITEEIVHELPRLKDDIKKEDILKTKGKFGPQIQLTSFLLELWKHLDTELAVILLDDVQNLNAASGVIDILRSVLSKDEILEKTNYVFVLASTPRGWEEFVDKHNPVGRFFRKRIYLEDFTGEETAAIITRTLDDTGVSFEDKVIDLVYENTLGHPYELQLLCSNLYDAQVEGTVKEDVFEQVFDNTLRELGRDYFESLYRRASEREKEVLAILAEKNKPLSISDIRSIMITEKRARNFPTANIKNFLYRLQEKELILRRKSGDFEILDPMFAKYLIYYQIGR